MNEMIGKGGMRERGGLGRGEERRNRGWDW
jgi:hypothetical protein